jgi:cobaltochelatase CobN
MTGIGFEPPVSTPTWGVLERPEGGSDGPTIAVLFYRAQQLAGNTAYVESLLSGHRRCGRRALPIYCASLRTPAPELLEMLTTADAMVVTVLAAGEPFLPPSAPVVTTTAGTSHIWRPLTFPSFRVCVDQFARPVGEQR